jgi:hypothetical protein
VASVNGYSEGMISIARIERLQRLCSYLLSNDLKNDHATVISWRGRITVDAREKIYIFRYCIIDVASQWASNQ